jgi:hypothetical protein
MSKFRSYEPHNEKDVLIYNYYYLVGDLLFYSVEILRLYEKKILNKGSKYTLFRNPYQHELLIYYFLCQTIFGQVSFHINIGREPNMAISIIRQMIELRIRRAIGVLGAYNKSEDIFEPIPMKYIFKVLKNYENDIDFSVPLSNLMRIYSWANIYLHLGRKDYLWKSIKVMDYLHTFMTGKMISKKVKGELLQYGSFSFGVSLKKKTLNKIRNDLEKPYNLVTQSPEALIT